MKLQQNPGKFDVSCPSFPCPPFLISGHLLGGGDPLCSGDLSPPEPTARPGQSVTLGPLLI